MKAACALLLALGACKDPASDPPAPVEPAPFRYETTGADVIRISTREGASPIGRVLVIVREENGVADDGVTSQGDVLFQGLTGDDGSCTGRLVRPLALRKLQVTLQHPGYEGRYDDPSLLQNFGPFAPAAWFSVDPTELASLTVDLHKKGTTP